MEWNIAINSGCLEYLNKNLLDRPGGQVHWITPDLKLHLYLDESIPDANGFRVDYSGPQYEVKRLMDYTFPSSVFPEDVTRVINISYQEILCCFREGCFLASISLCGKVIETVLDALYELETGHKASDEGKGANAMINALNKKGYGFSPSTKEKLEVIAAHRNMAVHGNIVLPTDNEARGIIFLTKDVMVKASSQQSGPRGPLVL